MPTPHALIYSNTHPHAYCITKAHITILNHSYFVDPPDLRHLDLLPPNPERTAISLGTVIPPVPPGFVDKIESGAFIEMGDLIPNCPGLEDTARSKLKCRSITNVCEWLQAFEVYVSIIARKQPHRVPDLMGYQVLILEASNEYKNDCWLAYDRCFHQQAASDPHCNWSNINSTLWNLVFTGQARANRCLHCLSLFHSSTDCELASISITTQTEQQGYSHARIFPVTIGLSVFNGMSNVHRTVHIETADTTMYATFVHLTCGLTTSITRPSSALTTLDKANSQQHHINLYDFSHKQYDVGVVC